MAEADGHYGEGAVQVLWAAQLRPDGRLGPGVRVFHHGSATAVISPGLSGRAGTRWTGRKGTSSWAVSRFVVDALVREHGPAALMVDADNVAAIAAYRRAGMSGPAFAAAARAWGSAGPS
nr:hypothetical protein OG999_22940 [Streptomyces sp. NBC_00886]